MIHSVFCHLRLSFIWSLRDRVLHAVLGASALLLLLAPIFSTLSMRQVQETALTLTLSASSFVLVVLAIHLGAGAVYRDVERRYTASVLTLPTTRATFIVGRFGGIVLFLILCATIFFLVTALVVPMAASINPSDRPAIWTNVALAFGMDACMAVLLAACALLFSTVSTSLTMPFFSAVGLYFAGSASQQVHDYLSGPMGMQQPMIIQWAGKAFYYLLPNFSAFDLHLQAIYGLPISMVDVMTTFAYFSVYTALVVGVGVLIFERRELS